MYILYRGQMYHFVLSKAGIDNIFFYSSPSDTCAREITIDEVPQDVLDKFYVKLIHEHKRRS